MATTTTRFFRAHGKVQDVMFRQTLIRGAAKRGLEAGASNSSVDPNLVTFTLSGDPSRVEEVVRFLKEGRELNDWGAQVDELEERASGTPIAEHQVTTANVDSFHWRSGVTMFL